MENENIILRPHTKAPKEVHGDTKNEVCNMWHESLQDIVITNMQDTYRITKQLTNHSTTIPLLQVNDKFAVI